MESADSSTQVRKPGPKPLQSSSPRTQYLILYNFVCAILWTAVLGRVLILVPMVGFGNVYKGTGEFTKWTQTVALLEVVHSATGMPMGFPLLPIISFEALGIELTDLLYRTCQIPSSHNHHTSFQPYSPRLGCCQYVPSPRTERRLLQHVTRMVCDRSDPLLLLRHHIERLQPWHTGLAEIQHILCALSIGY